MSPSNGNDPVAPPHCRSCSAPLGTIFADLGCTPLCQRHVEPQRLHDMEPTYPLVAWVCTKCWLVQLQHTVPPEEIFSDYAYFSSYSDTWLAHARDYAAAMTTRLGLGPRSLVVELASNDGYLLQFFKQAGIPVLGVEPAANVAQAAIDRGIPTLPKFFGRRTAEEITTSHGRADLIAANNVLAHVPDLHDFIGGMKLLLKPGGTITVEFPHLACLIEQNQFDTIYHEHWSYFSFLAVERVFASEGLTLHDVEEIPTHGGSLRIHARHAEHAVLPVAPRVGELRDRELRDGFASVDRYTDFGERVKAAKRRLLAFLIDAKNRGKSIAAYGAPGKGNTLLNYCGIRTDFIDYTVDRNPKKQGNYLPGSRIPILHPDHIRRTRPDYLLILPWNLTDEIVRQNAFIREWGGRFVVPIPEVRVLP
jgi:SAM-dependent methyltransferase